MAKITYEAINTPSWLPLLSMNGPDDDNDKPEWLRRRIRSPLGVGQMEAAAALFKHLPSGIKSEHIRRTLNPEIIRPHEKTGEELDLRVLEILSRPDYLDHMIDSDRVEFFKKSLHLLSRERDRPESYAERSKLLDRLAPYMKASDRRPARTCEKMPMNANPSRSIAEIGRELEELIDPAIYKEDRLIRLKAVGEELDQILSAPLGRQTDRRRDVGR